MKFAVGLLMGYVIGSRMLDGDYTDVTRALRAVARSDELRDVVHTVCAHATQTLREVADLLEAAPLSPPPAVVEEDLITRVTDLLSRRAR